MFNNDISKTVQVLTVILSQNWCLSQRGAIGPLNVFTALNSLWSIELFTALPGCCPLRRTSLSLVLAPAPRSGLPASVPSLSPPVVQCHRGGRGGYPSHGSSIPCSIPHINSPFSNPSVKATPHISSNSLHSLTKYREETLSHIASTSLALTHLDPAFSSYPLQEPQLSFQKRASHCLYTNHYHGSSIAVMLRPFQYSLSQFCLEGFHLLHQCMCHQPILTPIQQSIQYRPRRERTKVTLESTYAAIVKKGLPRFLDVLINWSGCQQIPLPPKPQTLSNIHAWQDWTIHYTLWNIHTATSREHHYLTFAHIQLQKVPLSKHLHHSHLCLQRFLAACQRPDIIRMKETTSIEVVDR